MKGPRADQAQTQGHRFKGGPLLLLQGNVCSRKEKEVKKLTEIKDRKDRN